MSNLSCVGGEVAGWTLAGLRYAAALARWWAAGKPVVAEAEYSRRLALCLACPELDGGRCRLCKCVVEKKALMATQACPLGPPRWGPAPSPAP